MLTIFIDNIAKYYNDDADQMIVRCEFNKLDFENDHYSVVYLDDSVRDTKISKRENNIFDPSQQEVYVIEDYVPPKSDGSKIIAILTTFVLTIFLLK